MINNDNIIKNFSSEEIIHIKNENVRLNTEINKVKFTNQVIYTRNCVLKGENIRLKEKCEEISYLDKLKDNFNKTLETLRNENEELNEVIVGLKNEIEYYKELIKKNKVKVIK